MATVDGRLLALVHAWKQCGLAEQLPDCQKIAGFGYVGVDGITNATRRPPGGQLANRQKTLNLSLARTRRGLGCARELDVKVRHGTEVPKDRRSCRRSRLDGGGRFVWRSRNRARHSP